MEASDASYVFAYYQSKSIKTSIRLGKSATTLHMDCILKGLTMLRQPLEREGIRSAPLGKGTNFSSLFNYSSIHFL